MSNDAMATGDFPQFVANNLTNTSYGLADLGTAMGSTSFATTAVADTWSSAHDEAVHREKLAGLMRSGKILPAKEQETMAKVSRRLVKVIIMDPNENIPLDKCILHSGEEKLTDLDDQELFFELDIKAMLAAHNESRVQVVDKRVKERVEHLEPARIRDLKMVVVTVAQF